MRVFITGIDGFVGRYLAHELSRYGSEVFGTTMGTASDHVMHMEVTDMASVRTAIQDVRPDQVFHLAGFTSVKQSWSHPEDALRVNRNGTKNVYTALTELQHMPKVLLTSTAEVYGIPASIPITETHPTAPNNPYAVSKLAQESISNDYPGITTVITRSFPHIGPGQSPSFVTSDFAQQIVRVERGQATSIHVGNLDARRDFTDVRDVVRAYRLLLDQAHAHDIVNVCSGNTYSIKELLDTLVRNSTSKAIVIEHDPERLRPSDIPVLSGSSQHLHELTGWHPSIDILATTLPEILDYWRKITW